MNFMVVQLFYNKGGLTLILFLIQMSVSSVDIHEIASLVTVELGHGHKQKLDNRNQLNFVFPILSNFFTQ